jgi:hypothetical protein
MAGVVDWACLVALQLFGKRGWGWCVSLHRLSRTHGRAWGWRRAWESQRSMRGIGDRRSTQRPGPRRRAGAWLGQGCPLQRKAPGNRAGNRHHGPFRPGCDQLSPWRYGGSFRAVPARRSPVTNVPEDRKEGEARIRRGMARQHGQTRWRQRATPYGHDRDHPGTARASGWRGDCTGLAQLRSARRGG